MLRRRSLERRLFTWLVALALLPMLIVLVLALTVGAGSLDRLGTLGPWNEVGESGRVLFEAAAPAARTDSTLAAALDDHRRALSESLVQANRWSFVGSRIATVLPLAVATAALFVALLALWVSRRMARQLARPVRDLVEWTELLARGEPLPAGDPPPRRDVREMRVLRDALRRAAAQIEAGRTRALEIERTRAWAELARRVAHEMKNPLTPLRLAAHRLARADIPALHEPVEVIEQETARLEELARSFAVLGRPPEGPPSAVDVRELLQTLLRNDVPDSITTSLTAPDALPPVTGHYDALLRAFRNILRNAVEAIHARAGDGGRIDVSVTVEGGFMDIVVADDGRGLEEGSLERIFEPDFTLKAGGTGLGLAIVRQAIVAHRGQVWARARPGGGAEFTVRLPIDSHQQGAETA